MAVNDQLKLPKRHETTCTVMNDSAVIKCSCGISILVDIDTETRKEAQVRLIKLHKMKGGGVN